MAPPSGIESVGDLGRKEISADSVEAVTSASSTEARPEEIERKAQIEAMWEQMNRGTSIKVPKSFTSKSNSTATKTSQRNSHSWMSYLGLAPKKPAARGHDRPDREPGISQNGTSEESKRLAAAALSNMKDNSAAASGKGKVEVTEVREFAGKEIEVKKFVDADSEVAEKAKATAIAPSAVDAILEQIKKKPKLSVLDKTKKDWGEYKDENKGLEEELDAYKKSSNQYLDKVSFLQRTDYREFERERDARLALQARRRPENMQEP